MKKILAALLALTMLASLCVISVSAWEEPAEEANWTRHSIFDDALVDLIASDGSDYPIPADYGDGQNDGSFQFWKGAGHLYQGRGLNVMNGAKVKITFTGTGIKLCTAYRNDHGFDPSEIGATLDGADVSSSLKDLIAPTDNNTDHTPILTLTGLTAGEHVVTFTCTSASYRFSLDYFDIENEGGAAPAEPAPKFVKMIDFDTKTFGTLDEENQIDGTGCASFTYTEKSGTEVFNVKNLGPFDLSGCDFVEFYLYISDVSKIDAIKTLGQAQIEICSDNNCDHEEATWNYNTGNGLRDLIVGEPQNGWNIVRLDIHKQGDNGAKWDHINWFRMYSTDSSKLDGLTLKFDYMYAYAEGEEIPAPQKGAPVTPDDPTPATFDAVSSVAVAAVAALGVALVASKKRH